MLERPLSHYWTSPLSIIIAYESTLWKWHENWSDCIMRWLTIHWHLGKNIVKSWIKSLLSRFLVSYQCIGILWRHAWTKNKECIYTERQKKLITSAERHTLKSKAFKWIIIGHTLAIIILTKHIYKKKRLLESKQNKIRWNRKRSFVKNHRNCSPPGHGARYGQ